MALTTTAAEPVIRGQRFKQLFEGIPVLAALVSPTGKLLGCSLPLSTGSAESQKAASALSLCDLPLWGGDALTAERLQRSLTRCAEGRNVREEMPFHRGTDETGILDLHLSPMVSQQGAVGEIMCLGIDQTALVRTQTEWRASERRFQEMTHALPMMIWVNNANGECMFANNSYVEFFGTSRNSSSIAPGTAEPATDDSQDWLARVHPDDTEFCQQFWCSVENRIPFRQEVRMKNTLGQWRYLECFCRPNYDPAGVFTGFTCTGVDLTEQYQAKQSIADSERRKDEFLATLAHELRNPLAPILTGVELIKQLTGNSATIDNALEIIERQSRQLSLLIDDLMDASRISQGNFQLRKLVVRLDDLVQEAVETCGPAIDDAQHEFTVALPPEPVWLKVDPLRITQVLTNLLKNATKFTEKGGKIELSMHESDACLVVRVTDNGRGFAPDTIDRVFDMYTQLNKRPANGDVGLGVGLALSKYLVNRHGGCLDVVSDGLGCGSTFSMHLPLTLKAEPVSSVDRPVFTRWVNNERRSDESSRLLAAVTVPDAPASGNSHDAVQKLTSRMDNDLFNGAEAGQGQGHDTVDEEPYSVLKVLVVDDNEDAAFIMSELLEHLGVETLIAHTGQGALDQFAAFEPDLMLVDIGLPDMDGYAVARSIRQSGAHGRRVRLVALTGLGGPDNKQKSLAVGFDEHRVKPLSLVHLGPLVQQLR